MPRTRAIILIDKKELGKHLPLESDYLYMNAHVTTGSLCLSEFDVSNGKPQPPGASLLLDPCCVDAVLQKRHGESQASIRQLNDGYTLHLYNTSSATWWKRVPGHSRKVFLVT